jgi:hypothetical protein
MDHAMALIGAFAAYARDRHIVISPVIKPHRFPGRGLGIAATRKIQVGRLCLVSCRESFIGPCVLVDFDFPVLHPPDLLRRVAVGTAPILTSRHILLK